MTNAALFELVSNDGKQDRMIMATAMLHRRLLSIQNNNIRMNKAKGLGHLDPNARENLPTLADIERTHILFTNSHFKPFCAIAFEYNKVKVQSGNLALNQKVVFSQPAFGDFLSDTCLHVKLLQPTLTATTSGNSIAPAMRWCEYPGERLAKVVQQEVNGAILDEYNSTFSNFTRLFCVAPNKLAGWNKCMGQEMPEKGFVRQADWAFNGVTAPSARLAVNVHNGNQTPSGQKSGTIELFIPLQLWYNSDVRVALPSVAIPHGYRFVNVEFCSFNELVGVVPRGSSTYSSPNGTLTEPSPTLNLAELYINNIFLNPEVHKIYIKRIGFTLIRVHKYQKYSATASSAEIQLQQLKWPIEYLMIGMKITAYHESTDEATIREHLDKWHLFSSVTNTTYLTTGQNVMKFSDLVVTSAGTETLGFGAAVFTTGSQDRGALTGTAVTTAAVAAGDLLYINGLFTTARTAVAAGAAVTGIEVDVSPTEAVTASTAIAQGAKKVTLQGLEVVTKAMSATMNNITVQAHGIKFYDNFPAAFFNSYTPFVFGGANINTPEESGALFIPFCLYPRVFQPSGYINLSRTREFFLSFDSSVVSSGTPGTLHICASAINFLLITDGSAILRYAT